MRAAPGMYVEWVDEEAVVLDPETGQVHYLNPPAAVVYASILEYGFEAALEELRKSHGDREEFRGQLSMLLDEMKDRGLLIDG